MMNLARSISTPWGQGHIDPGHDAEVYFVSTPSHGGFKVEKPALDQIPLAWRKASFNGLGMRGWFEEDCDWCMVALTFPERFTERELEQARVTFHHWIAPKLTQTAN